MKRILNNFDLLSKPPQLYLSGKSKVYSLAGLVFSILIYLLSISLISYYIYYTLDRKDFYLTSNRIFEPKNIFQINTSETFITINVMDYNNSQFLDEDRLFKIHALQYKYMYEYNNSTGENSWNIIRNKVKISKCPKDYYLNSTIFHYIYKQDFFNNHYCIEPNQIINISNPYSDSNGYETLNLIVTKCSNNSSCLNEQEIDNKMSITNINTNLVGYIIDSNNYTDPFLPCIYKFSDFSSSRYFKRQFMFMKNVIYQSDNGVFSQNIKEENVTVMDYNTEYIDFSDTKLNGEKILYQQTFAFNTHGMQEIYNRRYIRFQNAFGEVSAIINIFNIFCSIVISHYSNYIMLYEISKQYLCIEKSEDKNISYEKLSIYKSDFSTLNNFQNDMNNNIKSIYLNRNNKFNKVNIKDWKTITFHNPVKLLCNHYKCKYKDKHFIKLKNCIINFLNIENLLSIQIKLDYLKNYLISNQINKEMFCNMTKIILLDKHKENVNLVKDTDNMLNIKNNENVKSYEYIHNILS